MAYFLWWNNNALVTLFYAQKIEKETGTFKTLKIKSIILKKGQFDKALFTKKVDTRLSSPWHILDSSLEKLLPESNLFDESLYLIHRTSLNDSSNWSRFKDLERDYQSFSSEMSFLVNGPFKTKLRTWASSSQPLTTKLLFLFKWSHNNIICNVLECKLSDSLMHHHLQLIIKTRSC